MSSPGSSESFVLDSSTASNDSFAFSSNESLEGLPPAVEPTAAAAPDSPRALPPVVDTVVHGVSAPEATSSSVFDTAESVVRDAVPVAQGAVISIASNVTPVVNDAVVRGVSTAVVAADSIVSTTGAALRRVGSVALATAGSAANFVASNANENDAPAQVSNSAQDTLNQKSSSEATTAGSTLQKSGSAAVAAAGSAAHAATFTSPVGATGGAVPTNAPRPTFGHAAGSSAAAPAVTAIPKPTAPAHTVIQVAPPPVPNLSAERSGSSIVQSPPRKATNPLVLNERDDEPSVPAGPPGKSTCEKVCDVVLVVLFVIGVILMYLILTPLGIGFFVGNFPLRGAGALIGFLSFIRNCHKHTTEYEYSSSRAEDAHKRSGAEAAECCVKTCGFIIGWMMALAAYIIYAMGYLFAVLGSFILVKLWGNEHTFGDGFGEWFQEYCDGYLGKFDTLLNKDPGSHTIVRVSLV